MFICHQFRTGSETVCCMFAAKVTCLDPASSYLFLSGAVWVLQSSLTAAVCKQQRLGCIRHKVMFINLFAVLFSLFPRGYIFSQKCGSLSAQEAQEHGSEVRKLSLPQASSGPHALGVQTVWEHLCCSENTELYKGSVCIWTLGQDLCLWIYNSTVNPKPFSLLTNN